MKISYDWLNDFLDLRGSRVGVERVSSVLTALGFAVEGTEEFGPDTVFDLDITTNRPDCLNHRGVARELAVQLELELVQPDLSEPAAQEDSPVTRVDIESPRLCPRYAARVVTGVRVGPSPEWMRSRLESLGVRPINNVVDITNFVMLHLGQPMHAFDYEALEGGRIVVRTGRSGESVTTLDGSQHALDPEMLLICDAVRPVAVAGVMGGSDSEVSDSTRTVLLESAYFEPLQVRRTARKLRLSTEASYRFERGSDPNLPGLALNLASRLLEEFASGRCCGPVVDPRPQPVQREAVSLTGRRVRNVTGIDISDGRIEKTLKNLGFSVEGEKGVYRVVAPSFRVDVGIEADLVEEVLRHYGYDRVPSTHPETAHVGRYVETRPAQERLLSFLTARGFSEAVNYAFTLPGREEAFWGEVPPMLEVANPLTEEHSHLRASLLPGLIESVRHNAFHGTTRVRLFECGKVFGCTSDEPQEVSRLALVATGSMAPDHWQREARSFGYFEMKGILGSLADWLGWRLKFRKAARPYLESGTGLEVLLEDTPAGILGRLAGHLWTPLRLQDPLYLAELSLDLLYRKPLSDPAFKELPKFPSVDSDLSFLVDSETDFDRIAGVVQGLNTPDLRGIHLIDLYRGPELPDARVSFTVRLTFANLERTLTQEEANRLSEAIFARLKLDLAAEARS